MLIITGTYPPRKCGVGDYCQNLLSTPQAKDWKLYTDDNWSISTFFKKIKKIKKTNSDIINIQYPTVGYGKSILPHLLTIYLSKILKKKVIITLHEYSQLGWKGKLATSIFLKFGTHIIFTTEFERQYAIQKYPKLTKNSSIIKIYSNILTNNKQPSFEQRSYDMGYFGYIRPEKGLEDYIETTKKIQKTNPNFKAYIMGQTQDEFEHYHKPLLKSLSNSNITLLLNKSSQEVADILSQTKIAYLPYPDGLTERRGSFLASLLHHCIIVTTKGNFTTDAQLFTFNFVNKEEAHSKITKIINYPTEIINKQIEKINTYISNQIPASWEDVANEYQSIINTLQ
jgi:glycosyltransferase involved in cell wall biosynthesis